MVLYDGARITPKPPHRPLEKNAAILFVFFLLRHSAFLDHIVLWNNKHDQSYSS